MKKTFLLLSLGLVLAGCAPNPAANVPSAQVETPPVALATSAPATPAAGETPGAGSRYTIEPGTSKVEWVGSKVTRKHEGGFKQFAGDIQVTANDPVQAVVNVEIQTGSIYSDEEDLTTHLKSPEFFDVEKIPTSTFKSTRIAKAGDNFEITGDLTMHGVTKSITFPANISVAPDAVKAKAEFSINRMDFGIKYPGKADDLIRSEVVLKLDLNAPPAK